MQKGVAMSNRVKNLESNFYALENNSLKLEINRLKQLVQLYETGLLNPAQQRVNSSVSKPTHFKVIRGGL
jgi:hypothetical protein